MFAKQKNLERSALYFECVFDMVLVAEYSHPEAKNLSVHSTRNCCRHGGGSSRSELDTKYCMYSPITVYTVYVLYAQAYCTGLSAPNTCVSSHR